MLKQKAVTISKGHFIIRQQRLVVNSSVLVQDFFVLIYITAVLHLLKTWAVLNGEEKRNETLRLWCFKSRDMIIRLKNSW